jgi:hypothetical protein
MAAIGFPLAYGAGSGEVRGVGREGGSGVRCGGGLVSAICQPSEQTSP